jgi:O-antigen/teichoic acid export membrane protein
MMRSIKNFFLSQDTSESRGQRRTRRASLTGIIGVISLVITSGAGLISIPLTARYLGTERFGMWLILSTLLGMVGVADLGLANSLTNALATADGKSDQKLAKEAVSSASFLMVGVAVFILILLLIAYSLLAWDQLFNVSSLKARVDAGPAILACIIIFVLRLLLSIARRVCEAYQEGYIFQLCSIFSNLLSICALLVAIQLEASLPLLLGTFFGTQLLGDLFCGIYQFGWRRKWLRPMLHDFSFLRAQLLLKTGLQLWLCQISAVILFQTDLFIVAQLFGSREVASYGVTLKLFSFIGMISLTLLYPLWPAYSEALSRNDVPWIVQTFKKSICLSVLGSLPISILVLILCPIIVGSWVGQDAIPEQSLLIAMVFTTVITTVAHSVGVLINGLGTVAIGAIFGPIQGISNLLLSIFLGNLIGVSGVAWSTGICLVIFSLGIMGIDVIRKLKKFNEESERAISLKKDM